MQTRKLECRHGPGCLLIIPEFYPEHATQFDHNRTDMMPHCPKGSACKFYRYAHCYVISTQFGNNDGKTREAFRHVYNYYHPPILLDDSAIKLLMAGGENRRGSTFLRPDSDEPPKRRSIDDQFIREMVEIIGRPVPPLHLAKSPGRVHWSDSESSSSASTTPSRSPKRPNSRDSPKTPSPKGVLIKKAIDNSPHRMPDPDTRRLDFEVRLIKDQMKLIMEQQAAIQGQLEDLTSLLRSAFAPQKDLKPRNGE